MVAAGIAKYRIRAYRPESTVRRYSHSRVRLPRESGLPSMVRKMEEMVIIMAR